MFEKFRNWISRKEMNIEEAFTICNDSFTSPKDCNGKINNLLILQKAGGYQYIAADIVAKTVASQKIRLYAKVPDGKSRFTNAKEVIFVKHFPVDKYRINYLRGENEISHDNISYKTMSADNSIVEILDHPSLEVLRDQNPFSNLWEFIYTLTLSTLFFGNSYFLKNRDTAGFPSEMWMLPSPDMKIIQGKTTDDWINHYEWGERYGTPQTYQPEDVLNFKIPKSGNGVYGKSKSEVVWKYINLIDSSLAFQKAICDNTGRPDFLLLAENAASHSDDLKKLESKWNDRFYGPENAGKMTTIPGKVKIEILPRTEFDFDGDDALVRAIARGFGVPEYKVLPSSAIKANDTAQEKDFMKETIDSFLTLIENVLNENFLSEWDDSGDLFYAFDPVIKEDKEFKLKRQIAYKQHGIYTANRILAQEGEELIDGGDVLITSNNTGNSNNNATETSTEPKAITNIEEKSNKRIEDNVRKEVKKILDKLEIKETPVPVTININNNIEEEGIVEENIE